MASSKEYLVKEMVRHMMWSLNILIKALEGEDYKPEDLRRAEYLVEFYDKVDLR